MAERTKIGPQNTSQKTGTPLCKQEVNPCAPEGWSIPVQLITNII